MKLLALISITACSISLIGCGDRDALGSNGAALCTNAAQPFDVPLNTFLVTENMDRTSSWDYLQGIQPSLPTGAEVPGIVQQMEDYIDEFAVYEGPVTGITSLDNSLDTMDQTIANDEIGNIQSGRQQIRQAINDDVSCSYNNKDAFIRDLADTLYRYVLDYTFISSDNSLSRTVAYYVPVNGSNEFKATSLIALDPATFSVTGYNPPLASTLQFFESGRSLTIKKDYQSSADSSAYVDETPFTVGSDTEVKRFRMSIDYQTLEANIYTSDFISAVTCFKDAANERTFKDPTTEELSDYNCTPADQTRYFDTGYDFVGDTQPIPLETYTGSQVSSRQ